MVGEKIYEKFKQWKNKIFIISLILNVILGGLLIFSVSKRQDHSGVTGGINRLGSLTDTNRRILYDFRKELEIRKRIEGEREAIMGERQRIITERERLQSENLPAIRGIRENSRASRERVGEFRDKLQELSSLSE